MKALLLVFLGGGLGATCRYFLQTLARQAPGHFSFLGTTVANVTGCFLIGVAVGLLGGRACFDESFRLFAIVGFLGAYTTFSSFSIETIQLIEAGQARLALLNLVFSLAASLGATVLGLALAVKLRS